LQIHANQKERSKCLQWIKLWKCLLYYTSSCICNSCSYLQLPNNYLQLPTVT